MAIADRVASPDRAAALLNEFYGTAKGVDIDIIEFIAVINKKNIQRDNFKFVGHTDFIAKELGMNENLMLMVNENLRIGVATAHIPIGEVSQNLSKENVELKLNIMIKTLKKDFGIDKPKIALLGLNPHAGEDGLLGKEESEIIEPVISKYKNKGHLVFGPFPADGFFGTLQYQ